MKAVKLLTAGALYGFVILIVGGLVVLLLNILDSTASVVYFQIAVMASALFINFMTGFWRSSRIDSRSARTVILGIVMITGAGVGISAFLNSNESGSPAWVQLLLIFVVVATVIHAISVLSRSDVRSDPPK